MNYGHHTNVPASNYERGEKASMRAFAANLGIRIRFDECEECWFTTDGRVMNAQEPGHYAGTGWEDLIDATRPYLAGHPAWIRASIALEHACNPEA